MASADQLEGVRRPHIPNDILGACMFRSKDARSSRAGRLVAVILFAIPACLALAGCGYLLPSHSSSTSSNRPACVTLDSYSGVIRQVMSITPNWVGGNRNGDVFTTRWIIQDEFGTHQLAVNLSSDGCVCGTSATSQFKGGLTQGRLAGGMEGAAVAPVSELDYTTRWLEPKVGIVCPLAWLLHRSYHAESSMDDGTTWSLSCSRESSDGATELKIAFSVASTCSPPKE